MREAAAGVADLPVGHGEVDFGFAGHGVDEITGADRDVNVRHVVLMEQSSVMPGNADAESADVSVFKYEMMMRLFREGNRAGRKGSLHVESRAAKSERQQPRRPKK
jgi:predicted RNA methylase